MAFLNCANALKPILPKSQAWCVDGHSKFVVQIRPPQYWRIEVPNDSPDDKLWIEELKRVFGEVLRFEKTPCPFKREFTVELPEPPHTPVKLKPWRPVFQQVEGFKPEVPGNIYLGSPRGNRNPGSTGARGMHRLGHTGSRTRCNVPVGVRGADGGPH